MATVTQSQSQSQQSALAISMSAKRQARLRRYGSTFGITVVGLLIMVLFLMPIGYMLATAFKDDKQLRDPRAPLWPASTTTYSYNGKELPVYNVPTADGTKQWALVQGLREEANWIDPANPEQGVINWKGRYRTLSPVYSFAPITTNFSGAIEIVDFANLYRNTFIITILSTIGTLFSCILVAYGFARFRFKGKNFLFIVLISTIVLPIQATIIPLYILFAKIGWIGTWLPLIIPSFFANAYDVFLLRQYFLSIPKELDEAAMIDGASPLSTLIRVIIPNSIPAILAVTLFHFFFRWNDYFAPLVYLVSREDLQPISVGVARFADTFGTYPGRAMAMAILAMILPVALFFIAQRQFMQGVVVTGVEK